MSRSGESTARAMRGCCEQANAELQAFSGKPPSVSNPRRRTRDMSREIQSAKLEATHEALRRGAAELPHETAQQAAAMRRAVADRSRRSRR